MKRALSCGSTVLRRQSLGFEGFEGLKFWLEGCEVLFSRGLRPYSLWFKGLRNILLNGKSLFCTSEGSPRAQNPKIS